MSRWKVTVIAVVLGLVCFVACMQEPLNTVPGPKITLQLPDGYAAIPHQEVPEGAIGLSAGDCGACHQEIYQEWLQSTHSHAETDAQYQSELHKNNNLFLCINCHTPLENQQRFIVDSIPNGDIFNAHLRQNPDFDSTLQLEGINCATCHVREDYVIGKHGWDAPHKVARSPQFLSERL